MRFRSLASNEVVTAGHGFPLDLSEFLIGGLMLTVALMGSFLRSFVKWPKKAQAKSTSASEVADEKEQVQKQWNEKMVKIQVFPTFATPLPAPAIYDFTVQTHVDNELAEFDPEKDYAQVLAEARSHLKAEKQTAANNVPSSASKPTFWLQSSQQLAVYRELEAQWARETRSGAKPGAGRSAKLWRSLRFWQRSKKHQEATDHQQAPDFNGRSISIFATPQHPSFKPPRNHNNRANCRQGSSGPIYTDGLPCKPSHRARKSTSGPLSTKMLFYGGGKEVPESPYEPLHRSLNKSSSMAPSPPLYSV